ncbi:MarR family winged helix-turn-helix transcriptional regulator [Nocardiopsis sp. YSL2]|uniref:MarR family winged helix-turn-helix transcriptional regulator n=1 Tax=Nocardiopsis sp. YSL2 TaxID=2939492 RepID=UPI0026F4536C|nr:MarR family winged helix-turn-helix transcriptional regulator [Nocardiopsis sp. YSL2]
MTPPVDPDDLDTGTLALFVGSAAASSVQERIAADGFTGLRTSHGYLFQHLLGAAPTIRDLAAALEMTQQGASKAVAELEALGYAERRPDPHDARVRRVALTPRGHEAVDAARRARTELEERLRECLGDRGLDTARALLRELLDELGGTEAVRRRRVRPPR